jgi:hypothetical protein
MRTGEAEVKSNQTVVGNATFPIYDSVQEAIEQEGEDKILKLVNSQNKTDAMNATRSAATSKPTHKRLMDEVLGNLEPEEIVQFAGDGPGMSKFLEEKVEALAAQYEAARQARLSGAEEPEEVTA